VVYALVAVAVVAVALPGVTDHDSFPLSNYPMFSNDRGRVNAFDTAVGVTGDGEVRRLSPEEIAGGYEVIHAAYTVSKAIRASDADGLCVEIAERVRDDDVTRVEVVTETHDTITWFEGDETPMARIVHADCAVTG
jgi:hypothetical protein